MASVLPITQDKLCCQAFDPAPWQEKTHIWHDRLFLRDSVRQIMHIPLNMSRVITRMWTRLQKAGAIPPAADYLMLSYDPSPWRSELYMAATHPVQHARMKHITGTFISRVYDGPYKDAPRWLKVQEAYVRGRGFTVGRHYFYYTTCPKCAKRLRHNYVVIFTEVR
jgi:hypothetical protein